MTHGANWYTWCALAWSQRNFSLYESELLEHCPAPADYYGSGPLLTHIDFGGGTRRPSCGVRRRVLRLVLAPHKSFSLYIYLFGFVSIINRTLLKFARLLEVQYVGALPITRVVISTRWQATT